MKSFQNLKEFHTMRVNQPSGGFYIPLSHCGKSVTFGKKTGRGLDQFSWFLPGDIFLLGTKTAETAAYL
jgi:hypothetical protein